MDAESRIGVLERDVTRLDEKIINLAREVGALSPLAETVIRLQENVASLTAAVTTVDRKITEVRTSLDERDEQVTKDRKDMRTALLSLTGIILAALIAGIATVVAAGLS